MPEVMDRLIMHVRGEMIKSIESLIKFIEMYNPIHTVQPRLMATSVIWSPRLLRLLFWPPGKTVINFLVKKPSLIWSPIKTGKFFLDHR